MAITKAEFKKAFREVASLEFSHIPTDENSIRYTFSQKFNKRMEKLIKSQKKVYWGFVNTTSKRVAVILLAIFAMFTATFSVKAIREPIVNFIKQVYESFIYYSFDGDKTEKINKEYTVKIPDNFNQTNLIKNDFFIAAEYMNDSGDIIEFKQMTIEYSTGYFVDREQGKISTKIVDKFEVEYIEWHDTQTVIWTKDGYVFAIDCYGNIDYSIIVSIIKSLG